MRTTPLSLSFSQRLLTLMVIAALVLVALPAAAPAHAAGDIVVTTVDDDYSLNGFCSLREAIVAANINDTFFDCTYPGGGPHDVITLQSGTTYALTRLGTTDVTGDLDIGDPVNLNSGNLTIQASGSTNAIIDATAVATRALEVNGGNINLTLNHITVTNGSSTDKGAGLYFSGNGILNVTDSVFSNNTSSTTNNCGAAIYNNTSATVVIHDSMIIGNTCTTTGADGGAIYKTGGGVLTITNSTFAGNTAPDMGGALRIEMTGGTATITNSTFANNTAGGRGGGIQVKDGTVTISYSTFSDNTANSGTTSTGGALQADGGAVTVVESILANSFTGAAPGKDCDQITPGTITLSNSLVESNNDCVGTIKSSADPALAPLADNGGPTQTMALLGSSPALNAGSTSCSPANDQRGIPRPQGGACDLGSYEAVGDITAPALLSFTRQNPTTSTTAANTLVFRATFSEAVTQVNSADFAVNSATTATVTNVVMVDQSTYDVTVSGGDLATFSGVVGLDLDGSQNIEDLAGNALPNGEPATDQTYTIDNSLLNIDVNIGGELKGSYVVPAQGSERKSYTGVDNGPVKINSQSGDPIIASERINLKTYDPLESYAEVMGLPASKLSDTFIFPWYNNTGFLDSQIRFANVGNANTVVTIKIAGVAQPVTYPLAPNQGARVTFAGVDNGPVEVKSSGGVPIIAALRINLKVKSPFTSYSEFLGLSADDTASTRYIFPWYNNTGLLDSQLRFANVGDEVTTVTVKIGGVTQAQTFTLDPSESTRISYALDAGPVEVTSSGGVPITAAMRINLKNNTAFTSYTELMGMTGATLTDTRYLFPWYNNTGSLDSQLRFANVGSANTTVSIKINGVVQPTTYALRPNESVRVSLAGVDNGPVEVYSSGQPIIAALRINLKKSSSYDSYYEFMGMSVGAPLGLPGNQLSSTYWFPWYNNSGLLDSQLRFGVP